LTIAGDRLELSDAAGTRLAVFAAGRQASSPSPFMADGGIYEFEPIAGKYP
jgi:hypothetical protein